MLRENLPGRRLPVKKQASLIVCALLFSLAIPALGYIYLGPLIAFHFLIGYLGGFFLWLLVPAKAPYAHIQVPYWATLLAFLCCIKVEENVANFFEVLSEKITGIPVPDITPLLILSLLVLPVCAWLMVPFLVRRGYDFRYHLAWAFFASMGITELAHFDLPLLTNEPYGYFPGMASVVVLVPVAWWGMWRLARGRVDAVGYWLSNVLDRRASGPAICGGAAARDGASRWCPADILPRLARRMSGADQILVWRVLDGYGELQRTVA